MGGQRGCSGRRDPATTIKPGYSVNAPWFDYNAEEKLYYRFQYGEPQIDELTSGQLAYKNVILQYCPWENYEDSAYLHINVMSGGSGKYISEGQAIDITWKKDSEWAPTHYYDANGNEITLNPGKPGSVLFRIPMRIRWRSQARSRQHRKRQKIPTRQQTRTRCREQKTWRRHRKIPAQRRLLSSKREIF
ncbi:MAG: DUF3048 C-terminal domain-containing protein [Blautia marasmi]